MDQTTYGSDDVELVEPDAIFGPYVLPKGAILKHLTIHHMRNVAFIRAVARAIYQEACAAIQSFFLPGNFAKEL